MQDGSQYFVLLIITDGVISDMAQTKEAIVNVRAREASALKICGVVSGRSVQLLAKQTVSEANTFSPLLASKLTRLWLCSPLFLHLSQCYLFFSLH